MNRALLMVLSVVLCQGALVASDAKLLNAIGMVESNMNHRAIGDQGRAVGAYQMHPEAWADANAWRRERGLPVFPRGEWHDATIQRNMASAYLAVIRQRLRGAGYPNPSPAQLAVCWNIGPAGALRRGLPLTRYAKRVVSIGQSLPQK